MKRTLITLLFVCSALVSGYCAIKKSPSGLVSWWRAENNALDSADNNDGVLQGGTTFAAGEVGRAFEFHDVGDAVSAPTVGFLTGAENRTMTCWVRIDSFIAGAESFFAGYGNFGAQGQTYQLGAFTDNRLVFSSWGNLIEGPVLTTNKWYFVAVTSVGTNSVTLYLNGTRVTVGSVGSVGLDTPAGSQFFIGGVDAPFNTRQIIGSVDEVSVYNRALPAKEILAIYIVNAKKFKR